MFLVTEKSIDNMFTVADTDDGKIDIVSQDELKKAKQMGYVIKRNESMKSYTDFYKVCCKANLLGKLDDEEWHQKVLGLNLYNWSRKIKPLLASKFWDNYKFDFIVHADFFYLILNTKQQEDENAYIYKISKDGVVSKFYRDANILILPNGEFSIISAKEFGKTSFSMDTPSSDFSTKTKRKKGKLSHLFGRCF